MNPIFFPFTSLSQYDAKSILNFFDKFSYLSTSSAKELELSEPDWFKHLWREKGAIEPITLMEDELNPILESVKSWRSWADANYGRQTKSGYLQSIFRQNPYFTSDSDIFSIRSQIEKGGLLASESNSHLNRKDKKGGAKDNFLLFLRLAAIADCENETIDQKLSSIDNLESNLFTELKGEKTQEAKESICDNFIDFNSLGLHKTDRGEVMTKERIGSWINLFIEKKGYLGDTFPDIFVTTSRAAVDFLFSLIEKSNLMLDIDNFKVHKEKNSICNSTRTSNSSGAWSETFKLQWSSDIQSSVKSIINKGNLNININNTELFQFTGQSLTVMLVGLKK
ncbi:MAG: hypothetical protein HQK74_02405 [Desulfamplus sp.]|nr:hypothetical protein [Desulfamplus sp.]